MGPDQSDSPAAPGEAAAPDPIRKLDQSQPARAHPLAAGLSGLRANLLCGLRLAFLLRAPSDRLRVSGGQLILLATIDVLLAFGLDFAAIGVHGRFNLWGLPGTLFYLPLMLLAGYLIARSAREPKMALALPVALLSAGPYVSLLSLALYPLESTLDLSHRATYFAYFHGPMLWWIAIIGFTTTRTLTPARSSVKLSALALIGVLVVAPALWLPRASTGALWVSAEDESAEPRASLDSLASEEAFYAQPELLRRALSGIAPGTRAGSHLYFVGVAGYAEEDVFRKELDVIASLMRERFGTAGRSINLVNNPATALSTPLASRTSLARTLARIGQLMNRDDVLFLYLTSHGSEDQRFSLSFWPLHLRDLDPPSLRQMLDAAHIRWRIVVVSSCYSGGFIDALKSDTTLVMTAADAHHTSFGCGSESDFTYFGKAYFDQALRKKASFTGAFDEARAIIEARERGEGKTPSHPQISVGAAIREKLRVFEDELRKREK